MSVQAVVSTSTNYVLGATSASGGTSTAAPQPSTTNSNPSTVVTISDQAMAASLSASDNSTTKSGSTNLVHDAFNNIANAVLTSASDLIQKGLAQAAIDITQFSKNLSKTIDTNNSAINNQVKSISETIASQPIIKAISLAQQYVISDLKSGSEQLENFKKDVNRFLDKSSATIASNASDLKKVFDDAVSNEVSKANQDPRVVSLKSNVDSVSKSYLALTSSVNSLSSSIKSANEALASNDPLKYIVSAAQSVINGVGALQNSITAIQSLTGAATDLQSILGVSSYSAKSSSISTTA